VRALCPDCGEHHDVVRVLDHQTNPHSRSVDEAEGASHKDVYQVAPLGGCGRTWITEADLLEARARFDQDAIIAEEDEVE
jgi:hypothetical protein